MLQNGLSWNGSLKAYLMSDHPGLQFKAKARIANLLHDYPDCFQIVYSRQ